MVAGRGPATDRNNRRSGLFNALGLGIIGTVNAAGFPPHTVVPGLRLTGRVPFALALTSQAEPAVEGAATT